jgi:predicted anti-sigma-YlaC factor YlaD
MRFKIRLFFAILVFCSVSGILSTTIIPAQERTIRLGLFCCDGLILLMALLSVWRNRGSYVVWSLMSFLLISTITYVYTSDRFGILEHLNGLRDPLFFFSSLIVVYDLYYSRYQELFIRWFTWFLVAFAVVQIPIAVMQFLKSGAGDGVGGTYGSAGGSGYLSQILFLITFFLAVRYASLEDGSHFSFRKIPVFFALLLPCVINETKVSFFLLAAFVVLLAGSRRRILRTIPMLVLGLGLAYLLNYYYSSTAEDSSKILDQQFIEQYLLTNPTEAGGDLPRFQRLMLMFRVMGGDAGSILLGMGYGVIGGGNILGISRLGRSLYYLVQGSRILLFRIWIQGGLLAVLTLAFAMFAWLRVRRYHYPTMRKFYWFLAFSLLLSWFYNEAMVDRTFAPVAIFFMIWIADGGGVSKSEEEQATDAEEGLPDEAA